MSPPLNGWSAVRAALDSARPARESTQRRRLGQVGGRKVAWCGAHAGGQQVVAELLQRVDHLGRSPVAQRRHIAPCHRLRQGGPSLRAATRLGQGQGVLRPPACRAQKRRCRIPGQALGLQPREAVGLGRPDHGVPQATAADGGQQLVRSLAGQHKTHVARRFFQRLEQRVGRDMVHLLGRVDQHGLAFAACRCALRKLHRIAHGFDADLSAGLALFVVDIGLGLFRQRPAQRHHLHLGHQHAQVGMGAYIDGVAAAAVAAGALLRWCIAQPCADQLQPQGVLPQARRPLQQPRMAALGQQAGALCGDPGRQRHGGFAHCGPPCVATMMASQPLRTNTLVSCCHTRWRSCAASRRAKRWGAAAARSA